MKFGFSSRLSLLMSYSILFSIKEDSRATISKPSSMFIIRLMYSFSTYISLSFTWSISYELRRSDLFIIAKDFESMIL